MASGTRDCERMGLATSQTGALTGLTWRVFSALAHLREAWCVADHDNRRAIEGAVSSLLKGHSLAGPGARVAAARCLRHQLEPATAAQFLQAVGLGEAI